ncbi:dihydroorotase [Limibacillus halophilus]|uniref:Dihydroorotase n=1 Tax=Limibacillus halophilus TaxID=1579333 RepID=A0A839T184_9PROT|nr:dihydroorotase [Limibacillus halophilus]MBB3066903.1 dihydroorotase [Limibacillus halophilus]
MSQVFDLVLKGAEVATPNGLEKISVGVSNGRIAGLGKIDADGAECLDLGGLTVLPGVIDSQVHFREPGLEHKEDLESGTRAAALGGVTGVFEMPNTNPSTLTADDLANKLARAKGRTWVDHAFFMGSSEENAHALAELELLPGCCGIKIFMGSSTGSLLVEDDEALLKVLKSGRRRVSIHAEDEARLRERMALVRDGGPVSLHPEWRDVEAARLATDRILRLARKAGRKIHVLHISTAEEIPLLAANKDLATMEATPQHLTLAAPECYEEWGSLAQMNPPIREARHREALWQAVRDGVVDVIGSDHAPHTLEEKQRDYPRSPSGMPGVQTLLPLLLDHFNAGRLTLQRLIDLTSAGANRIFNIAGKGRIALGYDADFTVVDLKANRTIEPDWLASKCGWSPFEGKAIKGWPVMTIVRGHVVMREGSLLGAPIGEPIRFQETL